MLTPDQQLALDAIVRGENIFITGQGGHGKSYLLKHFVSVAKNKKICITSTTGLSAASIGGMTIHHFSGAVHKECIT